MIRIIEELPGGLSADKDLASFQEDLEHATAAQRSLLDGYYVRYKADVDVRVELEVDEDDEQAAVLEQLKGDIPSQAVVFVASKELILFDGAPSSRRGVAIEYPAIILHSLVTSPAQVYLQVSISAIERGGSREMLQNEDDDGYFMEISLSGADAERLYEALCAFSALHVDYDGSGPDGWSEDGNELDRDDLNEGKLDEDDSRGEKLSEGDPSENKLGEDDSGEDDADLPPNDGEPQAKIARHSDSTAANEPVDN